MSVVANLKVNRMPRNNDNSFTMIPNVILRDSTLSCKAKAVLFYLIGERDNTCECKNENDVWIMTVKGLTSAFKESIGSIRRSLDELMQRGYLVRTDILGENNLRIRSEYTVYEEPIDTDGKPVTVYEKDFPSNGNISQDESIEQEAVESAVEHGIFAEELKENFDSNRVNEIVRLMTDVLTKKKKTIWIGRSIKQLSFVKETLLRVDEEDIARILHDVQSVKIKNREKYLLKCLFEAGRDKSVTVSENNKTAIKALINTIEAIKHDDIDMVTCIYNSLTSYPQSAVRMYLYSYSGLSEEQILSIVN